MTTDKFGGFPPPNYTKIPNELLDVLMPTLGNAELRVALFVARKTMGWHKEDDDLSLGQIMAGTGLSGPSVINAIASLEERGLIIHLSRGQNKPYNFRLNILSSKATLPETKTASKSTLLDNDETSKATLPDLVKLLYPQKKDLKKGIKEIAAGAANNSAEAKGDETIGTDDPQPRPEPKPERPTTTPFKKPVTRGKRIIQPQLNIGPGVPPSSPPPGPDVPPTAWDDVQDAPPEARLPKRASGASKDAIERAIADVSFKGNSDLRIANEGAIRAWGKHIRDTNKKLSEPVTAETIYYVFEDSGYWQKHHMSLDNETKTRKLPSPGIVGNHTLNILAWGRGEQRAELPTPKLVEVPKSPANSVLNLTKEERQALRRKAIEGMNHDAFHAQAS